MSTPQRVALTGFYGHGNFGDDLMAVLFGLHLKQNAVPFSVFRLCEPYARRFGLDVSPSIDELIEGVHMLIWGGGGLLVSWSNWIYNLLYPTVTATQTRLIDSAIRRKLRLVALSVGGDGRRVQPLSPSYKERFINAAESITVRNPQDCNNLGARGITACFFPDIVWQTSSVFPRARRREDRMRIGLDLYPSNLWRKGALYLVPALQTLMLKRRDCEFVLIDSTNRSRKPYRGLGRVVRASNTVAYQFGELEQDLDLLASLDLLISTRYHCPMVALQYGVPVISLLGEGKTTLFWKNLGLDHICFGHSRMVELLSLLGSKEKLNSFLREFPLPNACELATGAAGHLQVLEKILLSPA